MRLEHLWADGTYGGSLISWGKEQFVWVLELVKRPPAGSGFQAVPHRWIVERTFGWLNRYRRLSKDYEQLTETGEALIYVAMTHLMVRRIARRGQPHRWQRKAI